MATVKAMPCKGSGWVPGLALLPLSPSTNHVVMRPLRPRGDSCNHHRFGVVFNMGTFQWM